MSSILERGFDMLGYLLNPPWVLHEPSPVWREHHAHLVPTGLCAQPYDEELFYRCIFKAFAQAYSVGSVCTNFKSVFDLYESSGGAPIDARDRNAVVLQTIAIYRLEHIDDVYPQALLIYRPIDPQDAQSWLIYLGRSYQEEASLAQLFKALGRRPSTPLSPELRQVALDLSQACGADTYQTQALFLALQSPLSVICGGPGTGKTTTVVQILEGLLRQNPALRIGLAAPTGKAASRMRQAIQINVAKHATLFQEMSRVTAADAQAHAASRQIRERTIHKWLSTPSASGQMPSADNPLDVDVFVVDEASMLDQGLARRIMGALGESTRVIILGDKHQLAAVGPGAVFADLTHPDSALYDHVVTLKVSRRFKEGTVISEFAHAINHDAPYQDNAVAIARAFELLTHASDETADFQLHWHHDPIENGIGLSASSQVWLRQKLDRYIEDFEAYCVAQDAVDANAFADIDTQKAMQVAREVAWQRLWQTLNQFKPLAAQRKGPMSVDAINNYASFYVRNAMMQRGRIDDEKDGLHFPGEVIIIRQNDAQLGVFNGDIGVILPFDEGQRIVRMGDSDLHLSPNLLPAHDVAYAITIHQSQGSEYEDVAVFMPVNPYSGLATRELLYTGVTRTQAIVHLFGQQDVIERAITRKTERMSGLVYSLMASS